MQPDLPMGDGEKGSFALGVQCGQPSAKLPGEEERMSGTEKAGPGLTRRGFLKTTGAVAGAAAVGGALPTLTGCSGSDAQMAAAGGEDQIFYNVCMVNCGNGSQCSFKTHVRDGKIMKISANTDTFRVSDEVADVVQYPRRACLRGRSHLQWAYSPERIIYPMRKVEGTERGAGGMGTYIVGRSY